jgi:hypothetical protein
MIQLVIVVTEKWDPEFGLTIAAMPITLGILFFAAYCTRKELRWGMAITIGLYCCALAYLVFKLVRMNDTSEFWRAYYRGVRKPLTTFAVATILLLAATIVNGVYCTLNFGRGLKNHFEAAGSGGFGIGEEMMKKTRRKLDESSLHSAEPEQRMSRLTIE